MGQSASTEFQKAAEEDVAAATRRESDPLLYADAVFGEVMELANARGEDGAYLVGDDAYTALFEQEPVSADGALLEFQQAVHAKLEHALGLVSEEALLKERAAADLDRLERGEMCRDLVLRFLLQFTGDLELAVVADLAWHPLPLARALAEAGMEARKARELAFGIVTCVAGLRQAAES